ncbi:AmmeMemoRadiSam system radical SAM enzyme [Spirochaeta dissipatitropha]
MECSTTLQRSADNSDVLCLACARQCRIPQGRTGYCGVRKNIDGRLVSLAYGRPSAFHIDPIEKKPFYHVLPGEKVASLGSWGCTMQCSWCQNSDIARPKRVEENIRHSRYLSPGDSVEKALHESAQGIAFTYNEPTVWIEYAHDTAAAAAEAGLYSLWISNAGLSVDAWKYIAPKMLAANLDLKGFRESTYRKYTGFSLNSVLDSIKYAVDHTDMWIEITILLIPGLNDDSMEIRDLCQWLSGLSTAIPLHFSAFHSAYKMLDRPRTPVETLVRAQEIAFEEGHMYVYLGNVIQSAGNRKPAGLPGETAAGIWRDAEGCIVRVTEMRGRDE